MQSTLRPEAINDETARVGAALSGVLADTFVLYVRTHGFHWNVTGRKFRTLHLMFEEQYNELWSALDPIAERIRALGQPAPGSVQGLMALAELPEAEALLDSRGMIKAALDGHLAVVRRAKAVLATAETAQDPATVDLLTQRIASHEKTAWMLRALLSEDEPVR